MFSYPLEFPSGLVVDSLRITPRDAVSRSESGSSFEDQVYDWGGEMWTLEGTLPLLERADAEAMICFLLQLKGRYGTFLYPMQDAATPRGTWEASGSPAQVLVDGSGQTGHTLALKGLAPNQAGAAKQGDYINTGSGSTTRLHKILADANADGDGKMTVSIWPGHRNDPVADNTVVTTSNCKGLFRLPKNYGWDIDANRHYLLPFGALEVV